MGEASPTSRWSPMLGAWLALGPVESAPIDLGWEAPAGCPSAAEVVASVEVGPDAHPVVADGVVVEADGLWSLTLTLEGRGGVDRRTLEGETCEAVAEAAALLIQVAAGPETAVADEPEPEPEPAPEPEPEPAPAPPLEREPEPAEPPPSRARLEEPVAPPRASMPWGLHARVEGMLEVGSLLPEPVAGGVAVAAGVSIPWVRLEARGTYVAPRRLDDPSNPGVGVFVDGWGVGGSGCGVWEGKRVFVPGCLGAQVGRTRARAFGLEEPGTGLGLWGHLLADVGLGVRVHSRVALTLAAQGVVALRRPRFRVRGFPPLFQTGVGAGRLSLGVEVALRRRD